MAYRRDIVGLMSGYCLNVWYNQVVRRQGQTAQTGQTNHTDSDESQRSSKMITAIMVLPNDVWFQTDDHRDICLQLGPDERVMLNQFIIKHSRPNSKKRPRWLVSPLYSGLSGFWAVRIEGPKKQEFSINPSKKGTIFDTSRKHI